MDLVAKPWTEDALSAGALMIVIRDYASSVMSLIINDASVECPEKKPHGSLAWSIIIWNGAVIDLSVMPRQVTSL